MSNIAAVGSILLGFLLQEDGGAQRPLQVVPSVDLQRYVGTWYEIARYPNRFQKQCVGDVTANYAILEDGSIRVINRCRLETGEFDEAEGKARRMSDEEPNTKLEVRFAPAWLSWLPFVWGKYWIIELAEDYSYAVIGEPGRGYLWILSRTPTMTQSVYDTLLARVREHGYDPARLVRTRQGN